MGGKNGVQASTGNGYRKGTNRYEQRGYREADDCLRLREYVPGGGFPGRERDTGKMALDQLGMPVLNTSCTYRKGCAARQTVLNLVEQQGRRRGKVQLENTGPGGCKTRTATGECVLAAAAKPYVTKGSTVSQQRKVLMSPAV